MMGGGTMIAARWYHVAGTSPVHNIVAALERYLLSDPALAAMVPSIRYHVPTWYLGQVLGVPLSHPVPGTTWLPSSRRDCASSRLPTPRAELARPRSAVRLPCAPRRSAAGASSGKLKFVNF